MKIRRKNDHLATREVLPWTGLGSWRWVRHEDGADILYWPDAWEPVPEERWETVHVALINDGEMLHALTPGNLPTLMIKAPRGYRWAWGTLGAGDSSVVLQRKVSR